MFSRTLIELFGTLSLKKKSAESDYKVTYLSQVDIGGTMWALLETTIDETVGAIVAVMVDMWNVVELYTEVEMKGWMDMLVEFSVGVEVTESKSIFLNHQNSVMIQKCTCWLKATCSRVPGRYRFLVGSWHAKDIFSWQWLFFFLVKCNMGNVRGDPICVWSKYEWSWSKA